MLTLKGKTLKGKNRVRELGSQWRLIRTEPSVLFSTDTGPWGLVNPVGHAGLDKSRWINLRGDKDFEVLTT